MFIDLSSSIVLVVLILTVTSIVFTGIVWIKIMGRYHDTDIGLHSESDMYTGKIIRYTQNGKMYK